MDYQTVLDTFFVAPPPDSEPPPATLRTSPGRRLRDAIEPIATQGIWPREVNDRCAALGLDFLGTYVWGRSASLGTAPPALVVSSFAVFAPELISSIYSAAVEAATREQVLEAREQGAIETLGRVLGEPEGVPEVTAILRRGLDAASGFGRPLFAALSDVAVPTAPWGALWRACELLREHRGDAHIAVCLSAGLDPVRMNILTELSCGLAQGSYTATRGWAPELIAAAVSRLEEDGLIAEGALTDEGQEFRAVLEDLTDDAGASVLDAIGDDLDDAVTTLGEWSADLVAAGTFPPDPGKRAAG